MKQRILHFPFIPALLLMAIAAFSFGCKSGGNEPPKPEVSVDITDLEEDLYQDIKDAKQIFYSLPSPLETAMLVKSAGAHFDESLLNPTDNTSRYTTNRSMALNLGIYTCDLSFASLYDQTQISIEYMSAAKKMADGLGILDAIDDETIERLEENVNNRDVIMDIVSETFLNSSSFLKDNDRADISAIVLIGGWIEGIYIASQLVEMDNFENSKLVSRIIDQKLSISIILRLMEENKENAAVEEMITQVNELKALFDKITIEGSAITTETDENNVTTLKSSSSSNLTPELFLELKAMIASIRESFVI